MGCDFVSGSRVQETILELVRGETPSTLGLTWRVLRSIRGGLLLRQLSFHPAAYNQHSLAMGRSWCSTSSLGRDKTGFSWWWICTLHQFHALLPSRLAKITHRKLSIQKWRLNVAICHTLSRRRGHLGCMRVVCIGHHSLATICWAMYTSGRFPSAHLVPSAYSCRWCSLGRQPAFLQDTR